MRELTPEEDVAITSIARFVVRFGLTVPAVLWLESVRPLSFIGSQGMLLLSPSIGAFLPVNQWDALASLLEEREGIEVLIQRIEEIDRGGVAA
ncbi:MAG TPA: hypothetical protein ENK18_06050 [Deltaproteobacteria bacterium]|nr:hypothetical protein [Deltaproteobacteria bacterium]